MDARVDEPSEDDEVGLLAREFNTMLDRLDRASAAQSEFMASVGHELRTPITIARGHLEVLENTDRTDPAAVSESTAIVADELRRMGRLVDDLMAIARADMRDFIRPRPLELVAWFEELELRLSGTETGRRVQVTPPPPIEIEADPDRLAQAVLNLVTNATVHTPQGTVTRVEAEVVPGEVVITVSDDGPGIPDHIRAEIFKPFVRAGEVPTSTGLGLAVVDAIVDAHGGRVEVDTSTAGTWISLHLPFAGGTDVWAEPDHEPETGEPASHGRW